MKHFKHILILVIFGFLTTKVANAQDFRRYYFTGMARVEMTNNAADGNVYLGDTVSGNRASSGFTVFDLGVNIQPVEEFKVTSIVRLQNQFGVFFGQGSSVILRQLKLEGLLGNKVKYELGDIDVGLTPFTLYNYQDTSLFESSLFSLRRRISNYENLNETSDWRVQGTKLKSILFWGDSSSVRSDIVFFGARTKEGDYIAPNRFITGGSILNTYSNQTLGLNFVRFFEQKDVSNQTQAFNNDVLSANISLSKNEKSYSVTWNTEAGISVYNKVISDTLKREVDDGFILTSLSTKLKKVGLQFGVKYRYVGANFYSAAAQSLRIDNESTSSLFPNQVQGTIARSPLLFDRYTAANVYNPYLSPTLMFYLPQYGNVLPYGDATPNRQGVSLNLNYKCKKDIVKVKAESHFLNEISGVSKRTFVQNKVGVLLKLDTLLGLEKTLELSSSFRNENTFSESVTPIDFQTNLLDVGARVEVLKNLNLLIGMKLLQYKGNEILYTQNQFNQKVNEIDTKMEGKQQWLAWGLQYYFSAKSFFTFSGNYVFSEDDLSKNSNYSINQYYLNYTLRF